MNAPLHPSLRDSGLPPFGGRSGFGHPLANAASIRWAALQEAGNAVAFLAGLVPEKTSPDIRNFPALLRHMSAHTRDRIERGIDDLAAVMEPGLASLLAVKARGADASAPALALWREFATARAAIIAMAPPRGAMGPPRNA